MGVGSVGFGGVKCRDVKCGFVSVGVAWRGEGVYSSSHSFKLYSPQAFSSCLFCLRAVLYPESHNSLRRQWITS